MRIRSKIRDYVSKEVVSLAECTFDRIGEIARCVVTDLQGHEIGLGVRQSHSGLDFDDTLFNNIRLYHGYSVHLLYETCRV